MVHDDTIRNLAVIANDNMVANDRAFDGTAFLDRRAGPNETVESNLGFGVHFAGAWDRLRVGFDQPFVQLGVPP